MKLDVDRLVADCYDAVNDHAPTKAVREVLARTVSDPAAVVAALGEAPPWASYELDDVRVVPIGEDSAALVYVGTGHRDGEQAQGDGSRSEQEGAVDRGTDQQRRVDRRLQTHRDT